MSIYLNWVSQTEKSEKEVMVMSSIATLKVYQCNDVLLNTEWCLDKEGDDLPEDSVYTHIQNYLNNPTASLVINLQIQGTEFRRKVWNEICNIPVGQVLSYSVLASKVNSGARAVANACRDNPFPGVIPCHRVVAINGLGGFMGEKEGKFLDLKQRLIELESKLATSCT